MLQDFIINSLPYIHDVDYLLMAKGVCPTICAADELRRTSSTLTQLCLISSDLHCKLFALAQTDFFGEKGNHIIYIKDGLLNSYIDYPTNGVQLDELQLFGAEDSFSLLFEQLEILCSPHYCAIINDKEILYDSFTSALCAEVKLSYLIFNI